MPICKSRLLNLLSILFFIILFCSSTFANEQSSLSTDVVVETIDPKFGIENELRSSVTTVVFLVNPVSIYLIDLSLKFIGVEPPLGIIDGMYIVWGASLSTSHYVSSIHYELVRGFHMMLQALGFRNHQYEIQGRKYVSRLNPEFWLKPTWDFFVSEVQSSPSTISEYESNRELLDTVMFRPLSNFGLWPASFLANGHIHMDLNSAFQNNPLLIRDFVVDFLNHPGLFLGPLASSDRMTTENPLKKIKAIKKVIQEFDGGEHQSVEEVAIALNSAGLTRGAFHGTAINFFRYDSVEFRFPRAQKNTEQILNLFRLFKARLQFLQENPGVDFHENPMFKTRAEQYEQVRDYVTGAGLEWEPYRKMLPRWWRAIVKSSIGFSNICQRVFSRKVSSAQ